MLQGPCVVAVVGELEPTGVAKHVGVDGKWHLGGLANGLDEPVADGTDWPAALGNEHVSPFRVLAAELAERPHLVTPDRMHAGNAARLRPNLLAFCAMQATEATPTPA